MKWSRILGLAAALLLSGCKGRPEALFDKLGYHNDPMRSGWNSHERVLTPAAVAGSGFGLLWRSEPLDAVNGFPPRLFATPLYVDDVEITIGRFAGRHFRTLIAVTSTGYAYAISAFAQGEVSPGTILWRAQLTSQPCVGGTWGNLATPIIDPDSKHLYVTSCVGDRFWQAHALELGSGKPVAGWPVALDDRALNRPGVNTNGVTRFPAELLHIQRGALALSPDASRLYVTFGVNAEVGWLVALDTRAGQVASAFSATARSNEKQGGMWAASGPAIDRDGTIYVATGASSLYVTNGMGMAGVFPGSPGDWGQSLLAFRDDSSKGLRLVGTYTPYNYCQTEAHDIDLGSSGPVLVDLDPAQSATPHLLVLGAGKLGSAYLLDRRHLPGSLERRPSCSEDARTDSSLLPPAKRPVTLFVPYTETAAMNDSAKSRTTAATFRAATGEQWLYFTGSSKTGPALDLSMPPSLVRARVIATPDTPAYLRIDANASGEVFQNPGSPVVSSNGGKDGVVWVLDNGGKRTDTLYGPNAPNARLYAFDARTLQRLWTSPAGLLGTTGKYNEPTVVRGTVFVGTDRIEAFGLGAPPVSPPDALRRPDVRAHGADAKLIAHGRTVFAARCSACHDQHMSGAPQRAQLAGLPAEQVRHALRNGVMRAQGEGLRDDDVAGLAAFIASGARP